VAQLLVMRQVEVDFENAFLLAAQQGERAMRWHVGDVLVELEIVGELCALCFLAFHDAGGELAAAPHFLADLADERGRFRHAFNQDAACALKRAVCTFNALVSGEIGQRFRDRVQRRVGQQPIDERLKPLFARDARLGAALGTIGRIKILELDFWSLPPGSASRVPASACPVH